MGKSLSNLLKDEGGQAVVEYMLTVAFGVTIMIILGVGFRKSVFKIWSWMTGQVAAPSPLQPADGQYRIRY